MDYGWKEFSMVLGKFSLNAEEFRRAVEQMNKAMQDTIDQMLIMDASNMAAIPSTNTSKTAQTLKLLITQAISKKYNGILPVRLEMEESYIMSGWYLFKLSIPGQTRVVTVTGKQIQRMHVYATSSMDLIEQACSAREEVIDDVLYAIYCLLDEEEDE